jgi:DNA-binding HxlR family transcriptional regulator
MARKKLLADIADVQEVMRSICDKWALLTLHQLSLGMKRHGELHRSLHGISHKMLTQTLRNLERDRLVRRTVHPVVPPRVGLRAHATRWHAHAPLHVLYRWTERHLQEIHRARRAADTYKIPPS